MLGQKWWPIGCDPYKITTEDFKQELLGLDLEIYFLNADHYPESRTEQTESFWTFEIF